MSRASVRSCRAPAHAGLLDRGCRLNPPMCETCTQPDTASCAGFFQRQYGLGEDISAQQNEYGFTQSSRLCANPRSTRVMPVPPQATAGFPDQRGSRNENRMCTRVCLLNCRTHSPEVARRPKPRVSGRTDARNCAPGRQFLAYQPTRLRCMQRASTLFEDLISFR